MRHEQTDGGGGLAEQRRPAVDGRCLGNESEQPGEKEEGNSGGLLARLEKARPKLQ